MECESVVFRVGCNDDVPVFALLEVDSRSFRFVVFRDGLAAGAIGGGRSTVCQQNIRRARATISAITCIHSRDAIGRLLGAGLAWAWLSISRRHWSWLARLDSHRQSAAFQLHPSFTFATLCGFISHFLYCLLNILPYSVLACHRAPRYHWVSVWHASRSKKL